MHCGTITEGFFLVFFLIFVIFPYNRTTREQVNTVNDTDGVREGEGKGKGGGGRGGRGRERGREIITQHIIEPAGNACMYECIYIEFFFFFTQALECFFFI